MKVLILGSGGREHALAWKFKQTVDTVYVAPGNTGMKDVATIVPIELNDHTSLIDFALKEKIDLTFVGPEQALVDGIVDAFQAAGLTIFGPNQKAAQIEGSKLFAKLLMEKYNIPTATYKSFTNYSQAVNHVKEVGAPIVIKADGLASGKGVVVAQTTTEALLALDDVLNNDLGNTVLVEAFLTGEEFSLMAFVNGEHVYPMIPVQDHKCAYDNETGPNTGGMGAYSPVHQISHEVILESIDDILIPTAKAMVREGCSFTGILYVGLILTSEGPKVIEYNARFGDPETEILLPQLENDLYTLITDVLLKKEINLSWRENYTLGVVMASKGYPKIYEQGFEIEGLDHLEDVHLFHMGTNEVFGKVYTKGGRVLIVVGQADTLKIAQEKVYTEIKKITCDQLYYRSDIGTKGLCIK